MRKITEQAVNAFMNGRKFKSGNTSVEVNVGNESLYYLHGNLIAKKNHDKIEVSLAGWNTNTTRERLNGIPGVRIHTKNGEAWLNGFMIDDDKFYTI